MFTSMEANRRNLIRVKLGYGRHKILVKRVVHEKVLVKRPDIFSFETRLAPESPFKP